MGGKHAAHHSSTENHTGTLNLYFIPRESILVHLLIALCLWLVLCMRKDLIFTHLPHCSLPTDSVLLITALVFLKSTFGMTTSSPDCFFVQRKEIGKKTNLLWGGIRRKWTRETKGGRLHWRHSEQAINNGLNLGQRGFITLGVRKHPQQAEQLPRETTQSPRLPDGEQPTRRSHKSFTMSWRARTATRKEKDETYKARKGERCSSSFGECSKRNAILLKVLGSVIYFFLFLTLIVA